jgi:hypothetical protein
MIQRVVLLAAFALAAAAPSRALAQRVTFGNTTLEVEANAQAGGLAYTIFADNPAGERLFFRCDQDGLTVALRTQAQPAGDVAVVTAKLTGSSWRAGWEVAAPESADAPRYMRLQGDSAYIFSTLVQISPRVELRIPQASGGEARSVFNLTGIGDALPQTRCFQP